MVRRAAQSLRTSRELQTKGDNLKTMVTQQLSDLAEQQRVLGITKGTLDITNTKTDSLNTLMDTHFRGGGFTLGFYLFLLMLSITSDFK